MLYMGSTIGGMIGSTKGSTLGDVLGSTLGSLLYSWQLGVQGSSGIGLTLCYTRADLLSGAVAAPMTPPFHDIRHFIDNTPSVGHLLW